MVKIPIRIKYYKVKKTIMTESQGKEYFIAS